MADLQLIQGEKFARTGGLKAGQLDNVGEQIGTSLEAVGKEVQEAMVKVSSWGDTEEAFNNDMQKVETDGFLTGNDAGFSEQDAASEYMTGLKKTYGDAAAKASRIENKSSDAYKNQVKIMNDVNAAAKNFAGQKDALIAARKSYQENPAGLSISNSFDTSSASQMNFLSGKGEWNVDEKGNIMVDGKKMSDMGDLKEKSELNSLATQVYSDTYESSLKTGSALTDTQIEKAGENVINSLVSGGNPKDNVASFAFDPLTGTQTLYSKDSEEGKALAENIKNWDSLTDVQKNQIYSEVAEKHKTLLKAQNEKGIEDYKNNNPSSDTVEETYYSTDDQFDFLKDAEPGKKIVKIGSELYMTDGKKIGIAIPDPVDGTKYTLDPYQSVSLKNSDDSFNYKGFSTIAQGSTKTRNVPKGASITTETSEGTTTATDTDAGDASTPTEGEQEVEVNIGGNTVTTTTGTKLPDEARGFSPPPPSGETTGSSTEAEAEAETEAEVEEAQKAEDELSDIELEEEISKEKFSMPLTDFRSGVRKGEITMQDVDTKIKILNAQYKKDSISEAKYKKDIKFINEKIMPLLPDDIPGGKKIDEAMIANQLEQDKKEKAAKEKAAKEKEDRKSLSSDDWLGFPEGFGEKEVEEVTSKTGTTLRNISLDRQERLDEFMNLQLEQEQKDELEIKKAVEGTPKASIASKDKFIKLKGSLNFPLVGGKGDSKLFRKQGEVKHEYIPGIMVQSNGLQFDVKEGSQAAAVSEGEVLAIQQASNGTVTVMVEHEGGYISLYGPLGTLDVKKGDAVNKNTSLGKLHTNKGGKGPKTVLKFQIWKDTKPVNPEEWLA